MCTRTLKPLPICLPTLTLAPAPPLSADMPMPHVNANTGPAPANVYASVHHQPRPSQHIYASVTANVHTNTNTDARVTLPPDSAGNAHVNTHAHTVLSFFSSFFASQLRTLNAEKILDFTIRKQASASRQATAISRMVLKWGMFVDAEVVQWVRWSLLERTSLNVRGSGPSGVDDLPKYPRSFVPTATGAVSAQEGVQSLRASLDNLSCKGGTSYLSETLACGNLLPKMIPASSHPRNIVIERVLKTELRTIIPQVVGV
ncbi:hypothetical protein B0H11DRAFT_1918229 [Mycena galericulata]|nr:hypothetical protein B0H11DRAFT_1918229 [Mycena galericulata]